VIRCARCGDVAPVPPMEHDRYDREMENPPDNVVKVVMPRKGWVPLADGSPRISCMDCATDAEIVAWHWPDDAA
jgi:hypothetical protein